MPVTATATTAAPELSTPFALWGPTASTAERGAAAAAHAIRRVPRARTAVRILATIAPTAAATGIIANQAQTSALNLMSARRRRRRRGHIHRRRRGHIHRRRRRGHIHRRRRGHAAHAIRRVPRARTAVRILPTIAPTAAATGIIANQAQTSALNLMSARRRRRRRGHIHRLPHRERL